MEEQKKIDVVLDTDAYNEIDDQFAIAYLLRSDDRLTAKAIYSAPFFNEKVKTPAEGMEKSFEEIKKVLSLTKKDVPVFKGSETYLKDENTPVLSDSAHDLIERAKGYSAVNPLYIVAIGAITNIASALLLAPEIAKNIVVVWLGGHSYGYPHTREFNMAQDIPAARVVMGSKARFVQVPCKGVVDAFRISWSEFKEFLLNKNELADYLVLNAKKEVETYYKGDIWSRIIWDVVAVAFLLNNGNRFMEWTETDLRLPDYDFKYETKSFNKKIKYVFDVKKDALFSDLIDKLCKNT